MCELSSTTKCCCLSLMLLKTRNPRNGRDSRRNALPSTSSIGYSWNKLIKSIQKSPNAHNHNNKVITAMVIRPLDDWWHILCSICVHSFVALAKAVRLFISSLYNLPMCPKMCSIDIFVNFLPVGKKLKWGLFDCQFRRLGGRIRSWIDS